MQMSRMRAVEQSTGRHGGVLVNRRPGGALIAQGAPESSRNPCSYIN
jgi:hypothetical protein